MLGLSARRKNSPGLFGLIGACLHRCPSMPYDCLAVLFAGFLRGVEAEECGLPPEGKGRGGAWAVCLLYNDQRKAGVLFPVPRDVRSP